MSSQHDKIVANITAKGIVAYLEGLTRDDNPYTVVTKSGKKWAKIWLQAYSSAERGICCDACSQHISKKKGYKIEYHNGFNYLFCRSCTITDVKPPELAYGLK